MNFQVNSCSIKIVTHSLHGVCWTDAIASQLPLTVADDNIAHQALKLELVLGPVCISQQVVVAATASKTGRLGILLPA